MRVIKFEMFVSTRCVGSKVSDIGEIEVPNSATKEEIEVEIEGYTRDWMFDNIEWGFNIAVEKENAA